MVFVATRAVHSQRATGKIGADERKRIRSLYLAQPINPAPDKGQGHTG